MKVGPEIGREPDIFVISPEDAARAYGVVIEVVPRIIIEVVSPGTRKLDLETKVSEYAALGVGEYWAVDPNRSALHHHRLQGSSYTVSVVTSGPLESNALPGFRIDVGWFWQDPLPAETDCLQDS